MKLQIVEALLQMSQKSGFRVWLTGSVLALAPWAARIWTDIDPSVAMSVASTVIGSAMVVIGIFAHANGRKQ